MIKYQILLLVYLLACKQMINVKSYVKNQPKLQEIKQKSERTHQKIYYNKHFVEHQKVFFFWFDQNIKVSFLFCQVNWNHLFWGTIRGNKKKEQKWNLNKYAKETS